MYFFWEYSYGVYVCKGYLVRLSVIWRVYVVVWWFCFFSFGCMWGWYLFVNDLFWFLVGVCLCWMWVCLYGRRELFESFWVFVLWFLSVCFFGRMLFLDVIVFFFCILWVRDFVFGCVCVKVLWLWVGECGFKVLLVLDWVELEGSCLYLFFSVVVFLGESGFWFCLERCRELVGRS